MLLHLGLNVIVFGTLLPLGQLLHLGLQQTPGRWGNPPSRGRKTKRVYFKLYFNQFTANKYMYLQTYN